MPDTPSNLHNRILYLIATPIGNLEDLSPRAKRLLGEVAVIAAEDTRRARLLLGTCGIRGKKILSLRERNEQSAGARLLQLIQTHGDGAYLSDAGTPSISDPGARLVRAARAAGIRPVPIPGASALTALLSVAAVPDGGVHFFGFPPRDKRREFFLSLASLSGTAVLFESPRRIARTLGDLAQFCGEDRRAVLARELTKVHEQIVDASLQRLLSALENGDIPKRGEFALAVETPGKNRAAIQGEALFETLRAHLPPRRAAVIAARFGDVTAADLYSRHVQK